MKVSSLINIHLRPELKLLLSHGITKDIFIKFCKENFVGESIDCYLLIQEFKNLINETKEEIDNNKINKLFHKIINEYIEQHSQYEINIDSQTRKRIITKSQQQQLTFTTTENFDIFDKIEFQLLLLLESDVLSRFARSKLWHKFVIENSEIATNCCSLEDLELLKSLKYTKEDIKRKYLSMKEIQFADMVCLDYSCFEYLDGSKDINVYFCTGDTFFEDFGKSNVAKTIGYLPFSAEVVISCLRDFPTVKKIFPTTVLDKNELNEDVNVLYNEMKGSKEDFILPSHSSKYHVKISSIFDLRTNYVCSTVIYFNSKYYFIVKCIEPPETEKEISSGYIYYKDSKRYCQKTIPITSISIHVITPISKDKCHYIHFASGNVGGVFSKIATLNVFKKLLGKVSIKSRETIISVLNEYKLEKYINIRGGYERAKKTIDHFNEAFGITTEACPFPKTFEELQEL
ncbi:hypothetical protein ABK040_007348 [Willaertia magna]